jgi:hypothetical protein
MQKYFVIVLCSFFAFSCSEEKEPTPYTYTQVFAGKTKKTWALDKVFVKKQGASDSQITLENCEKDDRYVFYANEEKKYEIYNGSTKCVADEDDLMVDHFWTFVNAGAAMTIAVPRIFGDFLIPFIVTEANESSMVLEVFANEENTISYELHFRAIDEE